MTIRQWCEDQCCQRGMFPEDARAVVDALAAEDTTMEGRWDHPVDGYPAQLLFVLRMCLDDHALQWIDANCPKAWYRPLFESQESPCDKT